MSTGILDELLGAPVKQPRGTPHPLTRPDAVLEFQRLIETGLDRKTAHAKAAIFEDSITCKRPGCLEDPRADAPKLGRYARLCQRHYDEERVTCSAEQVKAQGERAWPRKQTVEQSLVEKGLAPAPESATSPPSGPHLPVWVEASQPPVVGAHTASPEDQSLVAAPPGEHPFEDRLAALNAAATRVGKAIEELALAKAELRRRAAELHDAA